MLLGSVILGPLLALLTGLVTKGRNEGPGITAVGCFLPFLCIMALFGGWVWQDTIDADFSTGSDELWLTPLGGGFFASRFGSSTGVAAFVERSGTSSYGAPSSLGNKSETRIERFGCYGLQPVLALGDGRNISRYVLLSPQTRSLKQATSESQLRSLFVQNSGQSVRWLSEDDFVRECGPKKTALGTLRTLATLFGPVLLVIVLFALWLFRVLRSPKIVPP